MRRDVVYAGGLTPARSLSYSQRAGEQLSKALVEGNLDEKLNAILGCLREASTSGRGGVLSDGRWPKLHFWAPELPAIQGPCGRAENVICKLPLWS